MLWTNASGTGRQPSYDASGDLTADGTNAYLYDAEGRVCAMQSALSGVMTGYLYDAAGNRVAKGTIQPVMVNGTATLSCDLTLNANGSPNNGFTLTSQYLLGPGGEQMTELNAAGGWVHTNVMANGSLFATFDNDNKGAHFYLTDWLGTRRVQTNYLGAVENTWTSLPYGDALTSSANLDPTEQHFTGKERDTESGLDYFGARYYASSMGRFMSPDWSAKAEPVPYVRLDNPQSLNLYSYVYNNPMISVDLDGHWSGEIEKGEEAYTEWMQAQNVQTAQTQNKQAQQQSGTPAKGPSIGSRILNAWLKLTSPIDKATAWTDEHPMVMAPMAIVAALEGNEGPVEEDEALVQTKAEGAANAIHNWLGEGWSQVKSGSDLALRSADGTRRIRFDLLNSHGDAPHINVELWKMRNLYPGDQRWEQIFNKHIYPK